MKVRLVAQIFSLSVDAEMSAASNECILSTTSKFTINFINNMDKLFNIFNTSDTPSTKIFNYHFKNDDGLQ